MGELLLSLRKLLSILFWNVCSGPKVAGLIGSEESPDLRTGREYTCHKCA